MWRRRPSGVGKSRSALSKALAAMTSCFSVAVDTCLGNLLLGSRMNCCGSNGRIRKRHSGHSP